MVAMLSQKDQPLLVSGRGPGSPVGNEAAQDQETEMRRPKRVRTIGSINHIASGTGHLRLFMQGMLSKLATPGIFAVIVVYGSTAGVAVERGTGEPLTSADTT